MKLKPGMLVMYNKSTCGYATGGMRYAVSADDPPSIVHVPISSVMMVVSTAEPDGVRLFASSVGMILEPKHLLKVVTPL